MGFFSTKKVIVGTTVYNLAGDEKEAPNFLKTTVANHVLTGGPGTIAKALSSSYLSGPGIRLRRVYYWARNNYPNLGLTHSEMQIATAINPNSLVGNLPLDAGRQPEIRHVGTDTADYQWWARQWILTNHTARYNEDWSCRMDSGPTGPITVTFGNGDVFNFTPANYVPGERYLYVTYIRPAGRRMQIYIYKHLTGKPALDHAIMTNQVIRQDYYPVIPVRKSNQFVSQYSAEQYAYAKKAMEKATNGTLDDLIEKLKDNDKLDDIDHAHVVFGVPLNTTTQEGLAYIYRFFFRLLPVQRQDSEHYEEWKAEQARHEAELQSWIDWKDAQGFLQEGQEFAGGPSYFGTPGAPKNIVRVAVPGLGYESTINWRALKELSGSGLAKPDAKVGEFWFSKGARYNYTLTLENPTNSFEDRHTASDNEVTLFWQETANSWRAIRMSGLVHRNFVYANNFVEIEGDDAIDDEELSGFIIPLKHEIMQDLSLKESTQLSSTATLLVLSSYEVVKLKWYQTGLFKLVLVAAIIATAAFTGGFSAAGVGVLGTNLAVGTALGLSGLAAVVAGVVANAIAAAIMTSLISKGATAALGSEIGAIVGLVASMVAINGISNLSATGSFAVNFGSMARAENILKMTTSVGNAVAAGVNADTVGILEETRELVEDFYEERDRISELFAENIGYGNGLIDTLALTDVEPVGVESPSVFLGRTLMTGSDIADLSMGMLSNFCDLSLSTDLPLE